MSRPIIKFIADFGPLLIFFTIYFKNNNDLKLAIPPFIIATFIALLVVYFLEKKEIKEEALEKELLLMVLESINT